MVRAHRISYEIHNGPVPVGRQVLHRCDNKTCTNPTHLYAGTNADNMRDKVARGRQGRSITITEDQVRYIHEHPGVGLDALASELGIGRTSVYRIRRGQQRKKYGAASGTTS